LNPNGTDMYNYTWSPAIPGLDVNATNPMVSLLTSQTFTVTVVSPDGCEQVATVHVDVKENPEINFTPDEYTVCAGGMICLALGGPDTGSGGMTGSGSMTGSGVFTGSGTTTVPINPAITGSGTVVWTDKDGNILSTVSPFKFTADEDICIVARITDEFGCVGMDTVNVFVAPAIDLEAGIIGDGPFCIGDTLQLEATGNGIGDDDVSWYDDSGVFLGNGLNIVTTYTGNSPYHVQADNGLGCIEVVDIDIPEADPVNLMVDVADDGCGNYIFTATGNTTIIEYWCEIPFELIGTSNPGEGFAYNCFADKNIIVRGISPDGCIEDVVIPVTTGGAPGVDILYLGMSVDTISVCPGEEIMLEAVTDPAGLDVEWDPSGETTPTITVISEDGEICVTTIDPATGCESTDCVVVVTDGGLAVTIEAEPAEFCLGEEVTLTAVSMPEAVECTWSNGDTGTTITVTPAGVETYSVTCVDANGCEGVTEITLTPSSKDVEITGPATLCEGEDGIMSVVNPDPNCTYEWSTGDTGDTATAMGPGTYDVTATDPVTGCTGVATLTIGDGFGGDLTANADPDVISAGQTSTLCVDNPQAGWTYEWTDPDGNVIGTTECIDVNPNETTTYTVCVTNADGCVKCTTVTVTVEVPTCTLDPGDIPNMFTPNGDGSNDCYQIENFSGYSFAKLMIYDRWGEQVFMTMNPDTECWDGTFNGELLNPDVYGYHLTYECEGVDGETTEVGNITLLR